MNLPLDLRPIRSSITMLKKEIKPKSTPTKRAMGPTSTTIH